MADCLQQWITQTDLKQRNLFQIFEVLLEALLATGRAPARETCEALKTLKGSSNAAKLSPFQETAYDILAAVRDS